MSVFKEDILKGKVALVTGGGSGICKGITEGLMRHGCRTVITSRNQDRLDVAAEELTTKTGVECVAVAADVREPVAVEAAVARCIESFDRLDIVVNGAAGNFLAPAAKLSYNAFKTVMEIDTIGTFNVTKAAFDKSLQANGGSIINISATLHYAGQALQLHPGAAKAGVDAMTRHLAVEWGSLGIRVNAIAPGPIGDTEGMKRLLPPGMMDRLVNTIPLRRVGQTSDIADAAIFLSSDAASFITGAILVVDGGAWMTTNNMPFM